MKKKNNTKKKLKKKAKAKSIFRDNIKIGKKVEDAGYEVIYGPNDTRYSLMYAPDHCNYFRGAVLVTQYKKRPDGWSRTQIEASLESPTMARKFIEFIIKTEKGAKK